MADENVPWILQRLKSAGVLVPQDGAPGSVTPMASQNFPRTSPMMARETSASDFIRWLFSNAGGYSGGLDPALAHSQLPGMMPNPDPNMGPDAAPPPSGPGRTSTLGPGQLPQHSGPSPGGQWLQGNLDATFGWLNDVGQQTRQGFEGEAPVRRPPSAFDNPAPSLPGGAQPGGLSSSYGSQMGAPPPSDPRSVIAGVDPQTGMAPGVAPAEAMQTSWMDALDSLSQGPRSVWDSVSNSNWLKDNLAATDRGLHKYLGVSLFGNENEDPNADKSPIQQLAEYNAAHGIGGDGTGADGGGAGAGGRRGLGGLFGGSTTSYGLGAYQDPPSAPHMDVLAKPDTSEIMKLIEGAKPTPEKAPDPLMTMLAGALQGMSHAHSNHIGDLLLGLGTGAIGGKLQGEDDARRAARYNDTQDREYKLNLAEAKLKDVQMGAEFGQRANETNYHNAMNDYQRQLKVLEDHQPQVQMTAAGLMIQDIGPNGERRMRLDSRPIADLLETRMMLKGLGASSKEVHDFTIGNVDTRTPEGVGLNLAMQLYQNPTDLPVVFGKQWPQVQMEMDQLLGKNGTIASMTANYAGKGGDATKTNMSQEAAVRFLQTRIMTDTDAQKRFMQLRHLQNGGGAAKP